MHYDGRALCSVSNPADVTKTATWSKKVDEKLYYSLLSG
jgi:hypothetical protein